MNRCIAVVGCGYWGKNLVRNFAQLGTLGCVCDANEASLRAQAVESGTRLVTDYDEVLADESIRAVVLATPAAMHYTQAKEALRRGKDVFVEKPLALHFHEGQEIVELAEAQGAILMVGHVLEYHPAVVLLREIVQSGELGKLCYVYSNRLNLGKVRQEENILWSFAPHDIAVLCSLTGAAPETVSTSGGNYLQPEIMDVTVTNLSFPDGVRGHIFVSWLHPFKEQRLVVVGSRKMAVFSDTVREGKLRVFDKGIEWRTGQPVPRQISETTLFFDETEPLLLECREFVNCIRDRRTPRTDGVSALRVLKVLQAAQWSLERTGQPVALEEVEAVVPV